MASPSLAATPTTTSISPSATSVVVGEVVTFTVTVSPNPGSGTVHLIQDGVNIGQSYALDAAGSVTIQRSFLEGTHGVYASFQGNGAYSGSSSSPISITAPLVATSTALTSSATSAVVGSPLTLTATVSPNPGGGTVHLIQDGVNIGQNFALDATGSVSIQRSFLEGTHAVYASFQGNGAYSGSSSSPISITASRLPTSTALTSSANPSLAGAPVTLNATISPNPGGGNVRFIINNTYIGYTVPVSSAGVATLSWPLKTGSNTVVAQYVPVGSWSGSTSAPLTQVAKVATTTTLTSSAPTATQFETTIRFTARVSPASATGNVLFFAGTKAMASRPLVGGVATYDVNARYLAAGTHSMRATFQGSGTAFASQSPIVTQRIIGDTSVKIGAVALQYPTFYPVLDDYYDTVRFSGTLGETASVTVRIYNNASGTAVRAFVLSPRKGQYAVTWNGRNTSGVLVSAGSYRVATTVKDTAGNVTTVTRYVTVSHKRLYWHTGSITQIW